MKSLPRCLIEIILSFVQTQDVKNLSATCRRFNNLINKCTTTGKFNSTKILNCKCCDKYNIHPIVLKLRIANRPKGDRKYNFCSKRCKKTSVIYFPRCYFCFNTVTYAEKLDRPLFCSEACIQHCDERVPRVRYLI